MENEKKVNRLHLIYGYIISGLLLISIVVCWILSCKGLISENAFQNFSFAASIVSIVLAVVSIVYTIYSGAGVSNSVDILQEAEQNIKTQVDALNGLESRIIGALEDVNVDLSSKLSEVQNKMDPFIERNINSEQTTGGDNDIFNLKVNSLFGNILLYICVRAIELEKSWPVDIIGNENKLYVQGYLVAMASIPSLGFSYETDEKFQTIQSCSFKDKQKFLMLKKEIKKAISSYKNQDYANKLMAIVEDYFGK